jgi:hypothetical protein
MALTNFRRGPGAVLVIGMALVLASAPALAKPKTSSDVVKVVAEATRPDADGNQTVTFKLAIDNPYHIYANPVGNESLDDAATSITVDAAQKPQAVKVDFPAGEIIKDKTLGDYKVYEGKVTIKAHVRRAPGDTSPLAVSIKLQACDNNTCLVPGTIKFTVP